ncbi:MULTISPECIES: metallopeptidase family protein [unclassified Embleya]|uniref:metallopeptidase family protein n=2 Tax=Embleya TaxID=2699295 RepID=UPI0033B1C9BA
MRGPLAPPPVPIALTRAQRFDDLAADVVERLAKRWPQLEEVRFAVLDVPEAETAVNGDEAVALGRLVPATKGVPATIILYRRPLELRAEGRTELEMLVNDVLVEQVADLLGMDPDTIDPDD